MQWTANFQKEGSPISVELLISERNGTNQIGWGISINLRQYGFITPNLVGYFQVKKMKAIYGYGPLNWNGFGWKRKLF